MKQLLQKYGIPTASFAVFESAASAHHWIDANPGPCVVKADGLAAGKGVIMAEDAAKAHDAAGALMEDRIFNEAGARIIIEETMQGREISFFALCDGKTILPFGAARDYKRAFDGNLGPNTGGMGAYAPVEECTASLEKKIMDTIARPVFRAMQKEGCPYQGVMFLGLMLTQAGPKLIQVNARFGDPECQILMALLKNDPLPLLYDCAVGGLEGNQISWEKQHAALFVLAAKGYPGRVEKNLPLPFLPENMPEGVTLLHAGTAVKEEKPVSNGGRVLNVIAQAETLDEARKKALFTLDTINWEHGFFRRDIGKKT
jgi:phosphoribosylamine--glycine ligase